MHAIIRLFEEYKNISEDHSDFIIIFLELSNEYQQLAQLFKFRIATLK
jgi:hypothetical protein